jgi:hypothetical protein
MKVTVALALFAALGVAAAAPVPSHTGAKAKRVTPAKVSMKTARAIALAKVPRGRIQAGELEREHGKLIYSFDIRVPGNSGIEEVQVDAIHGAVVSMVHESPEAERKEARQEKQEARKGRADARAKAPGH